MLPAGFPGVPSAAASVGLRPDALPEFIMKGKGIIRGVKVEDEAEVVVEPVLVAELADREYEEL
jgi:hypothetical protein